MTYRNNFTTNANGPDIEIDVCVDTILAQVEFNENFEIIKSRHRGPSVLFYTDNGQLTPDTLDDVVLRPYDDHTGDGSGDLRDYLLAQGLNLADVDDMDIEKLHETVLQELDENNSGDIDGMDNDINDHGHFVTYRNEIACYFIRGYCQSDAAYVYVDHTQLAELAGKDIPGEKLQQEFRNLVFDAPVTGTIKITVDEGEAEYDVRDLLDDPYDYDRDQIINWLQQHWPEDVMVYIRDMLPNQPDVIG